MVRPTVVLFVLMHGLPTTSRLTRDVAPPLAASGYRVIVPYVRGYGPTRLLDPSDASSGQQAALRATISSVRPMGSVRPLA